jgi:hypothetical protein
LGARDAVRVIVEWLWAAHLSVGVAAAEAVSELGIKSAAETVRRSLSENRDEAMDELAYALGCVGSSSDVALILSAAGECKTPTARRRCLLGIARLLRVEPAAYRLLILDGFQRDTAMLEALRTARRSQSVLKTALDAYSSGDESRALAMLVESCDLDEVRAIAEQPVEEAFIVAWLACLLVG